MNQQLLEQLAPTGVLRVGVNMANFLLVTGESDNGDPEGVSPGIAKAMADKLGVAVSYVPFVGPGEVADAAADDVWDCLLYTSPSPRDATLSRMPSSA